MIRSVLAAAVAATAFSASSVHAATVLNLFWSSTSGTETNDETMEANGILEIDANAGETFDISDLISINVEVTGDTINDFTIDGTENTRFISGEIAADGGSATLTDFLFANFVDPFVGNGFGCDFAFNAFCDQGDPSVVSRPFYNIVSGRQTVPSGINGNKGTTAYASPEDALDAITLTQFVEEEEAAPPPEVVPIPGTAPLLLGGLGALALWRRRMAKR